MFYSHVNSQIIDSPFRIDNDLKSNSIATKIRTNNQIRKQHKNNVDPLFVGPPKKTTSSLRDTGTLRDARYITAPFKIFILNQIGNNHQNGLNNFFNNLGRSDHNKNADGNLLNVYC